MRDWDNNGKIDTNDELYDYDLFVDTYGEDIEKSHVRSSGISNFTVIFGIVLGLMATALVFTIFDWDVKSSSIFLVGGMWVGFSIVMTLILEKLGF